MGVIPMEQESILSYVSSWEKSGRINFTTNLKTVLSKNDFSFVINHLQSLANHLLLTQDSPITVDAFVSIISELFKCLESPTVLEIKIADLLWCCESLLQLPSPHVSERFHRLIAQCRGLVSEGLLKERLSEDILESCQLIPTTRQLFQSRYVKTKTRLFYKQHKFNLLREEGEGYAKVATELAQFEPSDRDGDEGIDQSLRLIKSLIGCFDLDPNRVLDLILDVCECRVEHIDFFLQLIKRYASDRTDLCHSVGHKFHFYEQEISTPKNLHLMAARFLQVGLIDLKTLYPHLTPSDSKNSKLYETASEIELKKRKKNNFALDLPPLPDGLPQMGDLKANADNDMNEAENINGDAAPSFEELFGNHQKLSLCEALVSLGDWENARILLNRFVDPSFPTSFPPLRKALCSLLHWMIDVVYVNCNPLPADLIKCRVVPSNNYSDLRQPEDITELVRRTFPIAYVLGPNLFHDQRLLVKFIRICQAYLAQANVQKAEKADPIYQGIFNLIDFVLLPSLSMIEANCVMSEEIWQILQHMPYDHRYRLYSQWKNVKSTPSLIGKRIECLTRTKYIIKRLTKDNIKLMGRQLGKLCHSNPCVVFDYILNSVQRYDNLIGPVVEACKYMSSLSYDVFMYCVIEQLSTSERKKFEDLQLSFWFQHICNITGQMCKRYQCDLTGIIQFVLNQLKLGSSYDLLLLRELMHKMTGIEITEEVTADQLEAMMGGEILRQEGSYYNQIRNTRKNSQRIKQVLLENDLALPCIFLMARHREGLVFKEGQGMHLKLCGKLHDQCQDTLVQFGSFLGLNGEELSCPSLGELVTSYHVPVDVAFFILRSTYRNRISRIFEERKSQVVHSITNGTEGSSSIQEEVMNVYVSACRSVASEAVEQIKPLHPLKVWEELTAHFYVLFWSLQASDLACPKAAYERQFAILKQQMLVVDRDKVLSDNKRKKEKERLKLLEDRLSQEQKQLTDHVARVMFRLKQEKDTWFQLRTKTDTITQFLQLCVYPRIAFTTCDALFAAKFIHVLHTLKTPNFSTLICFDRIFNDITLPVTTCTENEAHRCGRFLAAILDLIMRWHSSPDVYNPECSTFPGFVTVFRKGTDSNTKADQLEFENYRHVVHKWHYRITKATVACLESSAYVQIRNTLIVLIRIMDHYPRISSFGQAVERRLEKLIEEEKDKRKDLHALAVSYHGKLKLRRSTWVPDYEFHIKDECTAAATTTANTSSGSINSSSLTAVKRKVPAANNAANGERVSKVTKLNPTASAVAAAKSAPSSSSANPGRTANSAGSSSAGTTAGAGKSAADRVANTSSGGPGPKRGVSSMETKSTSQLNSTSPSSSGLKQEAPHKNPSVPVSSSLGSSSGQASEGVPHRRSGPGQFAEGGAAPEFKRRKVEPGPQASSQSRAVKAEAAGSASGNTGSGSGKRNSAPNGRSSASPKESGGESSRSRLTPEARQGGSSRGGDPSPGTEVEGEPRRLFKAPASSGSGERRTVLLSEGRASSAHHPGGSSVSRLRHTSPQSGGRLDGTADQASMARSSSGGRSGDDDEGESSGSGRRTARSVKVRAGAPKEAPTSSSSSSGLLVSHGGDKRSSKDKEGGSGSHLPSGSGGSSSSAWTAKHHSRSRSNPRK